MPDETGLLSSKVADLAKPPQDIDPDLFVAVQLS